MEIELSLGGTKKNLVLPKKDERLLLDIFL